MLLAVRDAIPAWAEQSAALGRAFVLRDLRGLGEKIAQAPEISYSMSGTLYASASGWILLSVPAPLVRGAFQALDENGIELPLKDGRLEPHISVFREEEVAALGGIDKITERGKTFHFSLGRLVTVEPQGWKDVATAWLITVHSPELQELRRSYGLSSLPNEGKHAFHITIGIRRRGVLGRNETAKAACTIKLAGDQIVIAVDLDGTVAEAMKTPERIEAPREGAREALKAWRDAGATLILNTCRGDEKQIKDWLEEHDIVFDHINESPLRKPGMSEKLLAEVYVDDKAVDARGPWPELLKTVADRLKLELV